MTSTLLLKYLFVTSSIFLLFGCNHFKKNTTTIEHKAPTEVYFGDEEGNLSSRYEWFDQIHSAAPDIDWKQVESENRKAIAQYKNNLKKASFYRDEIEIGSGFLEGQWIERGPTNQAGSIRITAYDKRTNSIYAISAGGTLWKGSLDGNDWEVMNQDYRFAGKVLEITYDDDVPYVLTTMDDIAYYSIDQGRTWSSSNGEKIKVYKAVTKDDGTIVTLARKGSDNSYLGIYVSNDNGRNFQKIYNFSTKYEDNYVMSYNLLHDEVFILENQNASKKLIYALDEDNENLKILNDDVNYYYGNARTNLTTKIVSNTLHLYTYDDDNMAYISVDTGKVWSPLSQLEERPWSVGLYSPSYDDTAVFMGAIECYKLLEEGTFLKLNNWFDYYDNVHSKLHADIMYIEEYLDSENRPFILISNHGGISKSYDFGITTANIALEHLNVGQFYDVRTDPSDADFIYGGTQDQGLQRGSLKGDNPISMEQVISGDYGHIVFTKKDNHMATVYPGGWISYYTNGKYGYVEVWEEIPNALSYPWIPTIEASPNNENAIYAGGGTSESDGGSRLIKYTYSNGRLDYEEFPHDFNKNDDGISAIGFNPINPNTIYILTKRGLFLYSNDNAQTFKRTTGNLSTYNYLYGSCILPSKIDTNIIYVSGSGYSNASVYRSLDGGKSFQSYSEGLPRTTVFNITMNEEETVLYAATEAGPFVRNKTENNWEYLGGQYAPNTRFWSVEYVDEDNIARFGTYGRGIWDFKVTLQPVETSETDLSRTVTIAPTPATSEIQISTEANHIINQITLYDLGGREITIANVTNNRIDISHLQPGVYILRLSFENKSVTKKIIKI